MPKAVRSAPGSAEKEDVSPARALAADRPLRERPQRDRSQRERNPNLRSPQPARGRSQHEIDALVTEHLPLASFAVNAVAARISLPGHVSRDDLLSCAHVALVEVAKRFDPSAGASFATYALARLQGAVLDELRSGDWASRSVRAAARRTDAAADALAMSLGRPPTREELAASLGVPRSELDNLQVDVHRAVMVSIDAESGADGTSLDLPDTGESPSARCSVASGPATCTMRSAPCPTGSTRSWSAISSVTNRSPTSPMTSASHSRASRRCEHAR